MTLALILGTRPEIIKFAPIVWELERRGIPFEIIHTGQHYDPAMDKDFFQEFRIPAPVINLAIGSQPSGVQLGSMIAGLSTLFSERRYEYALVQGDTNSALSGCISAARARIPVAHIEAGLRCGDRWMPEEQNRIMIDHICEWWFPPTEEAAKNLQEEGLINLSAYGNTIKDVLVKYPRMNRQGHILVTIHREENTTPERLREIIVGLRELQGEILFPMHPRTEAVIRENGIQMLGIKRMGPVPFREMVLLESGASCIITDSGGLQEEACILGVPCVTVRPSTERPETVRIGANRLCEPDRIYDAVTGIDRSLKWEDPYGDGHTAEKIVEDLCPR